MNHSNVISSNFVSQRQCSTYQLHTLQNSPQYPQYSQYNSSIRQGVFVDNPNSLPIASLSISGICSYFFSISKWPLLISIVTKLINCLLQPVRNIRTLTVVVLLLLLFCKHQIHFVFICSPQTLSTKKGTKMFTFKR